MSDNALRRLSAPGRMDGVSRSTSSRGVNSRGRGVTGRGSPVLRGVGRGGPGDGATGRGGPGRGGSGRGSPGRGSNGREGNGRGQSVQEEAGRDREEGDEPLPEGRKTRSGRGRTPKTSLSRQDGRRRRDQLYDNEQNPLQDIPDRSHNQENPPEEVDKNINDVNVVLPGQRAQPEEQNEQDEQENRDEIVAEDIEQTDESAENIEQQQQVHTHSNCGGYDNNPAFFQQRPVYGYGMPAVFPGWGMQPFVPSQSTHGNFAAPPSSTHHQLPPPSQTSHQSAFGQSSDPVQIPAQQQQPFVPSQSTRANFAVPPPSMHQQLLPQQTAQGNIADVAQAGFNTTLPQYTHTGQPTHQGQGKYYKENNAGTFQNFKKIRGLKSVRGNKQNWNLDKQASEKKLNNIIDKKVKKEVEKILKSRSTQPADLNIIQH